MRTPFTIACIASTAFAVTSKTMNQLSASKGLADYSSAELLALAPTYDTEKDGYLDRKEVLTIGKALGFDMGDIQMINQMTRSAKRETGREQCTYAEFIDYCETIKSGDQPEINWGGGDGSSGPADFIDMSGEPIPTEFEIGYFGTGRFTKYSASRKMDELWAAIVPDQTVVENPIDFYWSEWGTMFSTDMQLSFTHQSDEMPEGRLKLAHTQGLHAKVRWDSIPGTPFSGINQIDGRENILMRLSETNMLHDGSKGLKPSVSFKFLRNGRWSHNIVAMPSFHASDSWNFLKEGMLTRVAPFEDGSVESLTIKKKLTEGQRRPYSVGIADIFWHAEDGSSIKKKDVTMPYGMSFEPTETYKNMFSDEKEFDADGNQVMWYDQLKRIKSGAPLFTVKAQTAPPGVDGSEWMDIATISLTSDMFTSVFGDERLFFRHAVTEDEKQFWPREWMRPDAANDESLDGTPENIWGTFVPEGVWPVDQDEAKAFFIEQEASGCPFQWLLDALP